MFGEFGFATHVMGADGCVVHSGDDPGAAWCADSGGGECVGVADAFCCQLVYVWRNGVFVAEAADVRADVFT